MTTKLIDLTHTLTPNIPTWDMSCGFTLTTDADGIFKVQSMDMKCGIGTHMDAPADCMHEGIIIDAIQLTQLINPGYLIDISHRCHGDSCLTVEDIVEFEARYNPRWKDSCVLINTGWHSRWETPAEYHNGYRFPYIEENAAALLVEREIRVLGIDTLSPDRPESDFPVHRICLANNVVIVENVGNLSELPPAGFMVFSIPLKLENATESPIRLWATL